LVPPKSKEFLAFPKNSWVEGALLDELRSPRAFPARLLVSDDPNRDRHAEDMLQALGVPEPGRWTSADAAGDVIASVITH
jgi:hypothetical protein